MKVNDTNKARRKGSLDPSSFIPHPSSLFRRRLYVHINLLCPATSEYAIPVNEQQHQRDDHKNRNDRHYTRTATTTAIVVGHDVAPCEFTIVRGRQYSEGIEGLLPQPMGPVNHSYKYKGDKSHAPVSSWTPC